MTGTEKKYKVLLIEDNKINQLIISKKLKDIGHSVDIANNGEEGVKLYEQNDYDFILMDIMIPEMDGYAATKSIRNSTKNPTIPIIAITANVLDHDKERCLASGMDGYISKPLYFNELKEVLTEMGFHI
jgi:CheY-like chemotaxis protein